MSMKEAPATTYEVECANLTRRNTQWAQAFVADLKKKAGKLGKLILIRDVGFVHARRLVVEDRYYRWYVVEIEGHGAVAFRSRWSLHAVEATVSRCKHQTARLLQEVGGQILQLG